MTDAKTFWQEFPDKANEWWAKQLNERCNRNDGEYFIGMDKAASVDHSCTVTVGYKDGAFEVQEIIRDPDKQPTIKCTFNEYYPVRTFGYKLETKEEYKRNVVERAVRGE